ncbi:MAG: class II aldolase/adducin family protein [Pseudomonadota bacterium]
MPPSDPLRARVQRYCTEVSRDRLMVQAAGGNVSWKSGNTLRIKASGTWLAHAQSQEIFVPVDRLPIEAALAQGDYAVSPVALGAHTLRPSIETLLHALMPHRFVVHLHPVEAMAHLVRHACANALQAALGQSLEWALVGYHKPGAELAQGVHAVLRQRPGINVLLLKNHGVIVGGETMEEIERCMNTLSDRLRVEPRMPAANDVPVLESMLDDGNYRPCRNAQLRSLATDPDLYRRLAHSWAICPDHVVFLGASAVCLERNPDTGAAIRALDPSPPYVFIRGEGVLESRSATAAHEAQLAFYLDVMVRQSASQALDVLSADQIGGLLNWDAEKYRQALNRAVSPSSTSSASS